MGTQPCKSIIMRCEIENIHRQREISTLYLYNKKLFNHVYMLMFFFISRTTPGVSDSIQRCIRYRKKTTYFTSEKGTEVLPQTQTLKLFFAFATR